MKVTQYLVYKAHKKHVTDEKKYADIAVHLEKDFVCKHNAISFLSEMFSK